MRERETTCSKSTGKPNKGKRGLIMIIIIITQVASRYMHYCILYGRYRVLEFETF